MGDAFGDAYWAISEDRDSYEETRSKAIVQVVVVAKAPLSEKELEERVMRKLRFRLYGKVEGLMTLTKKLREAEKEVESLQKSILQLRRRTSELPAEILQAQDEREAFRKEST